MDLSRMKAEKDARDGQDLAMARQRQSEQVRLMREAQRVAPIPVRDLVLSIGSMLIVLQTAPVQLQPQQNTSQSQPQPTQQAQAQQPLTQQQLQHQHAQISQLHQIQAQQAIQSQRTTGAPSTIPNRSARLSTAVNARPPLTQQGQHLQQGRGVQVSVPLQAGAQANMVSFPPSKYGFPTNGLPQAVPAKSTHPAPKQRQYILWITAKFYPRTG